MKSKLIQWLYFTILSTVIIILWFSLNYIIFLFQPLIDFTLYTESLMPASYQVAIDTVSYDQNNVIKQIILTGDKGFSLEAYIKKPLKDGEHPAILLLGGMMTGKTAVNYAYNVNNILLISPDYPYKIRKQYTLWNILCDIHDAHLALHQQIRDNLVLIDYVTNYYKIEHNRMGIMGYSFGVPFAVATARIQQNIHNLALIYGGADFKQLLKINFKKFHPVINWFFIQLFWLHLYDFEPEIHARTIKNIPLLFINGRYDEKIPSAYAVKLHSAFPTGTVRSEYGKEIVWLESKHVHPQKKSLSLDIIKILQQWYKRIGFMP
jgi:hypothetical protein